jgi:hypothetical protein
MIFLIEYDREQGRILKLERFNGSDRNRAEEARLNLELDLRSKGIKNEVVLLEAANEEAVRRTHRRYFEDLYKLASPSPGA